MSYFTVKQLKKEKTEKRAVNLTLPLGKVNFCENEHLWTLRPVVLYSKPSVVTQMCSAAENTMLGHLTLIDLNT